MRVSQKRLPEGFRPVQRGVLLLGRVWPDRAYLYASFREAGLDVYGVEEPVDAVVAADRWPRRFAVLVMDVAGYRREEVAAVAAVGNRSRLAVLLLCGPFETERLPKPLPSHAAVLRKPVSVGQVLQEVRHRVAPT